MSSDSSSSRSRIAANSRVQRFLSRLPRSERGTAVVEFALIAPILFMLVFGILDFGRALNYYNDLSQIAGQGARAAAVSRNPDGTAIGQASGTVDNTDCGGKSYSIQCQLAKYYTTTNELKSGVQVCIPALPTGVGAPVTVHASYQFNFTGNLFGFTTITLSATQTERSEATPGYTAGNQNGGGCT